MAKPIEEIFGGLIDLARGAAKIIPGGEVITSGISLGEKIIGIIDDVIDDAPSPNTHEELDRLREELANAVKAKAKATSARLRGEE